MANNSQSRKWALTINNPILFGFSHEKIVEILKMFILQYFCLADEIATTGTYHTHIFMLSESPIRFSTIKNRFEIAHIEKAYGTAQENRLYILKEGKWANTDKAETIVPGTFEEYGVLPSPREEKAPAMAQLVKDIQDGRDNVEIITDNPKFGFHVRDLDALRQTLLTGKYAKEKRQLEVTYLYGATGTGKTRYIFEQYPAQEICRITNYRGHSGVNFDAYNCQDVLVFEEFDSQIPISDMLNYLDIYPLTLPARYNDRVACYTKVVLTSNIPLEAQYPAVQYGKPETWRALMRRIHNVIEYLPDGTKIVHKKDGVDQPVKNNPV
ncbi:MAG: viral replication protein [Clostridiales bacterium]|nr:viral replication protein [Clostridiales bacterium]MCC8151226.1 viral replication protein [Lachnospiraceae bacterium]